MDMVRDEGSASWIFVKKMSEEDEEDMEFSLCQRN